MTVCVLAAAVSLAAGTAQEKVPAATVAAESYRKDAAAGLRLHGVSPLPDGAIVSLQIVYEKSDGALLATHNAEVRKGAYSAEVPIFQRAVFPGRYLVQAQVAAPRQNETVRTALRSGTYALESTTSVQVGTQEDAAKARQAYLDEIAAAFQEIRDIRDAVVAYPKPGDAGWKAAVEKWVRRTDDLTVSFGRRMENRILHFGELDAEGFLPLARALRDVCASPKSAGASRIGKWMDAHAFGYRHHLGSTSEDLEKATKLLASIQRAVAEEKVPEASELLELDALLPEKAHAEVAEFVALIGDTAGDASRRRARMGELMTALLAWAGQGGKK